MKASKLAPPLPPPFPNQNQNMQSHHRGADPGSYSSIAAPSPSVPFFSNHPYGKQETESSIPRKQSSLAADATTNTTKKGHERRNSEGVSPVLQASLSSAKLGKSRAHREIGGLGAPGLLDHALPPTATSTAMDGDFDIYKAVQGREWEMLHVDAAVAKGGSKRERGRRHYEEEGSRQSRSKTRLDPRFTARSPATSTHRLGIPSNLFQRRAPKGDRISSTLASQASLRSPDKTCTATSNSNFTSAVIHITPPGAVRGMPPPSRHRHSSCSSRTSRGGSRASSPLDSSIQTLLRAPSSEESSDAGESVHRRHRPGKSGLSTSAAAASYSPSRPAARKTKLTTDVLSPTGSVGVASRRRVDSDPYGSRNLGSVGCRSSASVIGVPPVSGGDGPAIPTARGGRPRRHRTVSSGFLGTLAEHSLDFLARMGILTPPPPGGGKPSRAPSSSSHSPSRPPLALPPSSSSPAPRHHEQRHSRHLSLSSTATGASLLPPRGTPIEYSLDSSNRLCLSSSLGAQEPRSRADSGSSSLSSSRTSSMQSLKKHLSRLSFSGSKSKERRAAECAKTALEAIIGRIMDAQGTGPEATTFEVRKFVEGGGVDSLIRGIQTLGHDAGLAFNLMYVLRVTMMDPEARHQAVTNAKGHILLEHVPAVMHAHLSSMPIFRDGLSVMGILLDDPVTAHTAATLMLTPRTVDTVRKVRATAAPGSREEKLCADFLARAA